MILVIDTSSPSSSVIATIDGDQMSESVSAGRGLEMDHLRRLARTRRITKVAVASGPGSFTGLRAGVSFGLGLAKGLGIPIVPLPTLELQAARSEEPVTAVADAGRGRFYFLVPGGEVALGAPADIPTAYPLVGRVARIAGHRFKPEKELRRLVEAAAKMLETAREVPYGSLEIEYMQSFSIPTKSEPSAGFRGDPSKASRK
ncbi:MAG: tRNA (adenosine(37)-N6)-threonylcarbamoyltransferase complex dimerization subunit type 1 TsaB [Chloroflexi bacterium]|nr:MAG: tRNA (adenosine(37)-N6)-threonylcarbamoyltransferase complex dimerization subunit type 1 TsaB [Chloroflexota bacterium]